MKKRKKIIIIIVYSILFLILSGITITDIILQRYSIIWFDITIISIILATLSFQMKNKNKDDTNG